jgi:predicted nucleic acid-binding protein
MTCGIVFDASTAILLTRVDLLRRVIAKVDSGIGMVAADEAIRKQTEDARAIAILLDQGALRKISVLRDARTLRNEFRLGPGEAEAILLAQQERAVCATDDGPAIRCCKVLGIPFATAVIFLVGLVESGDLDIELGRELLNKLQRYGRYNSRIIEDAGRRMLAARREEKA